MVRYIRKDELYHYGVKGMKWRKRRPRPESNDVTGQQPVTNNISDNVVSGGVSAMNDEAYERLRRTLELKFKDMKKKDRDKLIDQMVAAEKKRREEKLDRYMRKRKLHRKALEYYNVINHSAIPYKAVIVKNRNRE